MTGRSNSREKSGDTIQALDRNAGAPKRQFADAQFAELDRRAFAFETQVACSRIAGGAALIAASALQFAMGGAGGGAASASAGGGLGYTPSAANDDRAGSGPSTVVYNISAGVMDGQSVQRAIRQSERSARGTGWSHRGGW